MKLDHRDLKWAIAASQHRSLRQAAAALNIRQSTLSRALRDLEGTLSTVLFERTNGGTHPTVEGQEFLSSAQRIMEDTEELIHRFKTRSRGDNGRVTIGVHASLSAGNLRATLIEHRRRFPDVERRFLDGSSDHLLSNLASSAIDIAIVADGDPRREERSLSLWSERVVVALPEVHPLSSHDTVIWSDLRHESLLLPLRGPGPEFYQLLIGKLGCSAPLRIQYHEVALDRFLTLVGSDCGILLALEGATGVACPGVTFREVHDLEGPTRLTFRAYWRASNSNPCLPPFLDLLRERYPELSTALDRG
jgi:DNA-binding transcriptional LysR family regulator